MWEDLDERAILFGKYIVETGCTVRGCAFRFGQGKSTVHKDVTVRLKSVEPLLYYEVRKVLDKNLKERHIRGGIATREKYRLHKIN